VVITVEVGDVEVIGALYPIKKIGIEAVIARENEPRGEERRIEPRVTQDRTGITLDENAGVADGGRAHA